MRYTIEFELPDNDVVLEEIKKATSLVNWSIWGYSGMALPKPAVKPERKKGKWHIFKGTGLASCDCGYITDKYSIYDFCPVCGAKNER